MIIRHLYLNKLISWIDKPLIKIITGVRRSGKSYLMKMVQEELLNSNIDEKNIIYVNFELLEFQSLTTYMALYEYIKEQSKDLSGMIYVFADEAQTCNGWEKVFASLLAEGGFDLYLTGSNASMLSGDLATHIAGRYIEVEVYPLTFQNSNCFSKLILKKQS